MEQEITKQFQPNSSIFTCLLCRELFEKPVTLACGHSYCLYCVSQRLQHLSKQQLQGNQSQDLVPVCPECGQIIWRPLAQLKDNVVISNLMTRYNLKRQQSHPKVEQKAASAFHYRILIECQETNLIPMPHCISQIVFTTGFMEEIIEQQSQTNPIMLRWTGSPGPLVIAGRISRPEIYHLSSRIGPNQTTFRAQFDGLFYATVLRQQKIMIKPQPNIQGTKIESPLTLCSYSPLQSINRQELATFNPFFEVYDTLNNPTYLRQISQLVNTRILNDRNDPEALIYCIMRVLRLKDQTMKYAVQSMDDKTRWQAIQTFLLESEAHPVEDIIKIEIPGNFSSMTVLKILCILLVIYYLGI